MELPATCIRCRAKPCERSTSGTLAICDYDIAYYNDGGVIIRAESAVPMRMVCTNLRHEVHHILNLIVEQATIIQPNLSSRRIDLDDPASRILAATTIIDLFIQMLTGVYEFHPTYGGEQLSLRRSLAEIVHKYFAVYSVLKGIRRASDLKLRLGFDPNLKVSHSSGVYEYLTAILLDNAWKYATANTTVAVDVQEKANGLADVSFSNLSDPIPATLNVFAKGCKGDVDAEGFGYGLYWATILADYYNRQVDRTKDLLELRHSQEHREEGLALQTFTICNADVVREGG